MSTNKYVMGPRQGGIPRPCRVSDDDVDILFFGRTKGSDNDMIMIREWWSHLHPRTQAHETKQRTVRSFKPFHHEPDEHESGRDWTDGIIGIMKHYGH